MRLALSLVAACLLVACEDTEPGLRDDFAAPTGSVDARTRNVEGDAGSTRATDGEAQDAAPAPTGQESQVCADSCPPEQPGEPVQPELHDSAREQCRALITGAAPGVQFRGALGRPAARAPAFVQLLPAGGVRVTGTYQRRLDVDAMTLELDSDYQAIFIIDLDAACRPVSTAQLAPQGLAWLDLTSSAVDARGNTIVAGRVYKGSYDFGHGVVLDGTNTTGLGATYEKGATFLTKLDAQGHVLWTKGLTNAYAPLDLRVDGAGNIVMLTGSNGSSEPVDLGGGPVADDFGVALAKYAPTGELLWAQPTPDALHLDVAPDGQIAFAEFLAEDGSINTGAPMVSNAVLLDADGKLLWRRGERVSEGGLLSGQGVVIAIGGDGRVVVRTELLPLNNLKNGHFLGSVSTRAYDRAGEPLWQQTSELLHLRSYSEVSALSVDRWGSVASASTYYGPLQIGAITLDSQLDEDDVYVSFFDPSGRPRWGFSLNSRGGPALTGVDTDEAGNVVVSALAGGALTDLVVVKLAQ